MEKKSPPDQARSSVEGASHSSVGRTTGPFSRIFGASAAFRSTGKFLRRQLWAWPIIAAVVLGGAGLWVYRSVEDAMRDDRANDLNTILDASVTGLTIWMDEQKINVQLIASDEQLRPMVRELLQLDDDSPMAERNLVLAKSQQAIRDRLKAKYEPNGYDGFFLVAPNGRVLASDQDAPIGKSIPAQRKELFDHAHAGKLGVSKPYRSPLLLLDEKGELRSNLPTMIAVGPIKDENNKPIAALALRIRPEDQFTKILQVARFGKSGETYAFDRNGLLLSQSRFDDDLKRIGLLADQPDSRSILTLELRDPGVNMVTGHRPKLRRAEQPLTQLVAEAVKGNNGFDADGYLDYRGVPSVGAWRWLDEFDMGVGTEVDVTDAYQPVYILRRAFWTLMVLLVLCAIGIFFAMLYMARQQKALQKATLEAKKLGQYTLEQKLGSGGMGTVYKAKHAMLRRPTAVKLLDVDKMSDAAVARFEREVQLTGALTHPNTVAIYDYGRTPEGIFYYAMEYLDGINLDDLVKRFGPLTEARAVYILKQLCGALTEAHAGALVHRDIKPANIFLTNRGGMFDFVKVLDFGLVKALDGPETANVTSANAIMGTPLYFSPEAIRQPDQVDARTDIYAVGAVAFYLLTATPVFSGATVIDLCNMHLNTPPEPPSKRLGKPISDALEKLILRCLAKSPLERPNDAGALLREFEECAIDGKWNAADAKVWWAKSLTNAQEAKSETGSDSAPPTKLTFVNVGATAAYEAKG